MKKLLSLALILCMVFGVSALAETKVLTGEAEGFGGPVQVEVTVVDGVITEVKATGDMETAGIATPALEELPGAILAANGTDVDVVAGATYTSQAILKAVNIALGNEAPETPKGEEPLPEADRYIGYGISSSGRIGPGKDSEDVQVYSINEVFATVIFDKDGKIEYAHLDQLEVATPNYDGASMPHFSGYPGQSYNYDSDHDEKVDSVLEVTQESFQAEIASFMTKRARGDGYKMGTGTWYAQMDRFQELFVGKTVEEVNDWFAKYTSDRNGRPLKAGSENAEDAAKWDKLTAEDQAMLADVTTTATMSLNDSHGDLLAALQNAFDNRQPFALK
ncbi:MAG: FMN-binding protein [Eubacteriales bacterium]|nr:FMN-binding protein [Eubacteriales bacterium]MDD4105356.1 FMN-binding protein [Eubacteriales bacterium]MDD4711260.1 FMN-binding protein [Eubacteriales bacterium]NLO14785.1 FMN-binding protein [Clostridiales bacterium]